jgi:hypothetical protein
MAISRQRKQFGPAESAYDACDSAGQANRACKILPFRQARSRKFPGNNELVLDCVAVERAYENSPEESRGFLAACLPEYPDTVSCHGFAWGVEEPTGSASSLLPRWLKRALLMSTFTAWTAAAIALTIALG